MENEREEMQVVFIDFGQAVDVRHTLSESLLKRDLKRVQTFFTRQGVKTMSDEESLAYVVEGVRNLPVSKSWASADASNLLQL